MYGICFNCQNELLVVLKREGPYSGKYDLPGGSLNDTESLNEALIRECKEETAMEVDISNNYGCYDFLVESPYNGCTHTHHIAQLYGITIKKQSCNDVSKYVYLNGEREENDSLGAFWKAIEIFNKDHSSPLILKACQIIKNAKVAAINSMIYWK